jgi:hypothetical protein
VSTRTKVKKRLFLLCRPTTSRELRENKRRGSKGVFKYREFWTKMEDRILNVIIVRSRIERVMARTSLKPHAHHLVEKGLSQPS